MKNLKHRLIAAGIPKLKIRNEEDLRNIGVGTPIEKLMKEYIGLMKKYIRSSNKLSHVRQIGDFDDLINRLAKDLDYTGNEKMELISMGIGWGTQKDLVNSFLDNLVNNERITHGWDAMNFKGVVESYREELGESNG